MWKTAPCLASLLFLVELVVAGEQLDARRRGRGGTRALRVEAHLKTVELCVGGSVCGLPVPQLRSGARVTHEDRRQRRRACDRFMLGKDFPGARRSSKRPFEGRLEFAARGRSSVGRASASQAVGRGFEPRRPLKYLQGFAPPGHFTSGPHAQDVSCNVSGPGECQHRRRHVSTGAGMLEESATWWRRRPARTPRLRPRARARRQTRAQASGRVPVPLFLAERAPVMRCPHGR